MLIERLEQIAAVVVTAGLVAGNFFLFTPWRSGHDPRERHGQPRDIPAKFVARNKDTCSASEQTPIAV
jgi:hypothetical protein